MKRAMTMSISSPCHHSPGSNGIHQMVHLAGHMGLLRAVSLMELRCLLLEELFPVTPTAMPLTLPEPTTSTSESRTLTRLNGTRFNRTLLHTSFREQLSRRSVEIRSEQPLSPHLQLGIMLTFPFISLVKPPWLLVLRPALSRQRQERVVAHLQES